MNSQRIESVEPLLDAGEEYFFANAFSLQPINRLGQASAHAGPRSANAKMPMAF